MAEAAVFIIVFTAVFCVYLALKGGEQAPAAVVVSAKALIIGAAFLIKDTEPLYFALFSGFVIILAFPALPAVTSKSRERMVFLVIAVLLSFSVFTGCSQKEIFMPEIKGEIKLKYAPGGTAQSPKGNLLVGSETGSNITIYSIKDG
ncbi:MAG TPA: hypothetical protein ENN43_00650, partial [bacterium]|nr:hypothetical protein [bacterium]